MLNVGANMPVTDEIARRSEKILYRKVIDEILHDIQMGKLPLGSKLPSQSELIRKYKVSTGTIRQSLAGLERRGIIRKEHGRGSFVSLQSGRRDKQAEFRHLGLLLERSGEPEDRAAEAEIVLAFVNACRQHKIRFTYVETGVTAHAGGYELIKTFDGVALDGMCVFLRDGTDANERLCALAREFTSLVALFTAYQDHSFTVDCVEQELRVGMRHMMKYLLSLGHRRIAYVSSFIDECLRGDPKRWTGGRWEVYVETLAEAGIQVDPSLLVDITFGQEPDETMARQVIGLLRRDNPVTAIFAGNDWIARHVMEWLWREGIHVPGDVSVAGLDDVNFARQLVPSLTTVATPFAKMAQSVVNLLQKRFLEPDRPIQRMTIPSELIVRDSVGPVSKEH